MILRYLMASHRAHLRLTQIEPGVFAEGNATLAMRAIYCPDRPYHLLLLLSLMKLCPFLAPQSDSQPFETAFYTNRFYNTIETKEEPRIVPVTPSLGSGD